MSDAQSGNARPIHDIGATQSARPADADRGALWRLSAVALAEGIRTRQYTCAAVLDSVLGRIDALNPTLNAITVDCREEARVAARAADAELARGAPIGPLHGVPVTIKENVDQRGHATTNGVPAFAHVMATDDAPIVAHLRRAGAIIVGRTNTPEFSLRPTTDNPLRGRTRNPWHEAASPGGSSGGAGAAAAAGFGPIHHCNDIGGSLRFPAFACGVASVKPTQGRVPAYNPTATAERGLLAQLMSVQGAIAREVRDVRLATEVMAAGDARDPWWVPVPFRGPSPTGPIRVALSRAGHGYPLHREIGALLDRAAQCLQDAGYEVEEVETPSIQAPAQAWFDVAVYELRATVLPLALQHGSPTIQRLFEWYSSLGDLVDAEGYRHSIAERTRMTREWSVFLERYPLVLTPFLLRPLYGWNYDAESEANAHDLFGSAIWSTGVNYLGLPAGVVPVGFAEGLPAAVQVIGRRFREDLILDALESIEDRVGVLTQQLWDRK
ncbi:MAG: amidase [Gammaproteobacteria bacterium]